MPRNDGCTACPLHANVKTVCTWGKRRQLRQGVPLDAVVIGEAPGVQEDERGEPFVGRSGALITDALLAAGLTDVYFTNVVKCFPNRAKLKPAPAEIKACALYLDEELAVLQPHAVLALGETAFHRVGGVGSITEQEGREFYSEKIKAWVMPARHPANILRNRGAESAWKLVISRYALLLQGQLHDEPPVEVRIAKTDLDLFYLRNELIAAPAFTFDFETRPIDWWHHDFKALSIAFSLEEGRAWAVPLAHPQSPFSETQQTVFLKALAGIMTQKHQRRVAHNQIFDDLVFYRLTGTLPYTTCDTMLLSHVLDENRPKGLKWLLCSLLGWPDYGLDTKTLEQQPLDEVLRYNGADAAGTFALRQRLLPELAADPRLLSYFTQVTMPGIRAIERIAANGIYVDRTLIDERIAVLQQKRDAVMSDIPVENPGSTQQVAKWLYEEQGLPVLKRTPAGAPSTDEETIWRLARRYPPAQKLLEYRAHAKNINTYLEPTAVAAAASIDGRIHPEYRAGGAETGRYSSRFHTTPRDTTIRSVYTAPPGRALVSADYRQVEARLVAWAAAGKPAEWSVVRPGNSRMLRAFRKGIDVYVLNAAAALGKAPDQITKHERQEMGKVPVLANLYKISAAGLQAYAWSEYQLDWSLAHATHLWNAFHNLWPEIRAWHQTEEAILRNRGWTQSAIGRKRRLPGALDGDHEALTSGINMPIQSLASNIAETGAILFQERLAAWGYTNVLLVGFVHDSLMVECDDDIVPHTAAFLTACMRDAVPRLKPLGLQLPDGLIDVEVTVGAWGSKTTIDDYVTALTTGGVA